MPTRRQITRLNLEEATSEDYEECLLLGSDDELDETARTVKRRRIETLGEAYLQGRPLFISSASLRGPFDKGWVNPWRKHRKQHDSGITLAATVGPVNDVIEYTVPDTNDSISRMGAGGSSRARSIRSDVQGSSSSPIPKRAWNHRSSTAPTGGNSPSDAQTAQAWLKRHRNFANIQNYDPPKSPSTRYASSGGNGTIKLPKNTSKSAESGLARAMKSYQTDLRNVRRNKPVSGDLQEKHIQPSAGSTSFALPENEIYHGSLSDTKQTKASSLTKTTASDKSSNRLRKVENDVVTVSDPTPRETNMLASASSVHIVPPSSHLPEFKYRIAKVNSRGEPENQTYHSLFTTENGAFQNNSGHDRESSPIKLTPLNRQQDQASIIAPSTITLNCSEKQHNSLTESEMLPSAQVVPKLSGTSNCFISLHSAEYRGPNAAENGTASVDGELSTQAAFELAQKSFQDDLATPQTSFQGPPKTRLGANSSVKRITPFADVITDESAINTKIGFRNTPGTNQNMNTQAMIDTFTPFSDAFTGGVGKEAAKRSSAHLDIVNADATNRTDVVALPHLQPRLKSPHGPSFQEAQTSEQDSLPALPLTLSGTTPASNQQDGQGYLFSMDVFDVSQVIKDAGTLEAEHAIFNAELATRSGSHVIDPFWSRLHRL
ncbi:conserved hypothetical protein [Talaromyces stipitatus ATCC 10500]|uniref:Protamine P1 n=1 Tax=Talaromyces stipitatus (strain ATCC 10500 / CBS 375.48 / QM 6759 / NRRL 1006) TaxID=441959 RepID=B8MRJ3_TALSN|nr:uncharacterized protein TSTA_056310 [Talaromyces stipitatus ATCC 10500]EED13130.1 conserved hypothetical protein [Talaromyces stipitatus ATCC 10500]